MPLKWVSYAFPTFWAADALRSVMIRGWNLEDPDVYTAVLVVLAWQIAFLAIAIAFVRRTE